MNRRIVRSYFFSDREVNEALVQWMRVKDVHPPTYIADTPGTTWTKEADGIRVEWTVDDTIEI